MKRISNFLKNQIWIAVVVQSFLLTPIAAQSEFAPQGEWPQSANVKSVTGDFDSAVQQANFEREAIENHAPLEIKKTPGSLLDNIAPMACDFTKKLKDRAGTFLDTESGAGGWTDDLKSAFAGADIGKVFSSLAIVLGGYFGFVWFMRKFNPRGSLGLPEEVVEVLGQAPFGGKKNLQLVRLGSKLLLLMNGNEGTKTIGEITDPQEVEYLASLCGAKRSMKNLLSKKRMTPKLQSNPAPQVTGDLKKIIQQLRQVADSSDSSVFEA